jgi:glutathione S-transferase
MYKLHNVRAWGSISTHCLLEEMEVPYTNIWMTAEQVKAPEFRDISPLGLIPALGLADGRSLFESAAIVSFLVAAHPAKRLAPPAGSADHGEFLSWLHFMSANLYQTNNLAFSSAHHYAMNESHAAFIVARATERADQYWGMLDRRLAENGPWLMGDAFSALDLYAFMLSLWGRPSEAALHAKFSRVASLTMAVRARPKLKATLEAHGVMELGGYGG